MKTIYCQGVSGATQLIAARRTLGTLTRCLPPTLSLPPPAPSCCQTKHKLSYSDINKKNKICMENKEWTTN